MTYARWLEQTNNITQQFLAIGGKADFVSLAGGLPANDLYPVEAVKAATIRALDKWKAAALEYGPVEGFPPLREAIARRISKQTGRTFAPENILVTTGAMQGLDLVGKVFLDPGDLIVTQFPTYLGALDAWRPREPRYAKLDWDREQPDFPETLRQSKFVYAVPNYSNPTGALVSTAKRQHLLDLTRETGTWIVEDDPYLPLQLDGDAGPSILELEGRRAPHGPYEGRVIYCGTLSKSVVPGLRVGWAVAPADLVQKLALAKQSTDLAGSMFTHAVALEFIDSDFEIGHTEAILALYRTRRDTLLKAAAEHLSPWFEWETPPGGMFVWMRAKRGPHKEIDTDELYAYALQEKVAFVPSSVFDYEGRLKSAIRVNFTRSSPEIIEEGIRRLRRAVERYLKSNSGKPDTD